MSLLCKLFAHLGLSFLLVWNSVAFAEQSSGLSDVQAVRDQIAGTLDLAGQLDSQIDTKQFDLQAALDGLDYDSDQIIQFVKGEIAFEPYKGLLRGAKGTLMSLAGNSLDQAVLLSKLLKDAGFDARIRGGELERDQISQVLEQVRPSAGGPQRVFQTAAHEQIVDRIISSASIGNEQAAAIRSEISEPLTSPDEPSFQESRQTSKWLLSILAEAQASVGGNEGDSALQGDVSQYFWVEYRDGPSMAWKSTQPVFVEGQGLTVLPGAVFTFEDEIPTELQHRVRIQVFTEQKLGNKLIEHAITEEWERPAANLHAHPLTYTNIPQQLSQGLSGYPDAHSMFKESAHYIPGLTGDSFKEFRAFDLRGNVIDSLVTDRAESGVFEEVNRAFSSAAGAMSGEGDAISLLTAQWLEFTFVQPGGGEKKVRRYIYDALGAADRAETDFSSLSEERPVPYSLFRRHTFMFSVGEIPKSFELSVALNNLISMQPLFNALLVALQHPSQAPDTISEILKDLPSHWSGMTDLVAKLDSAEALLPDSLVFRPGPSLTIYSEGLVANDRTERIIDIVANPRRVVSFEGEKPQLDAGKTLFLGTWDT